MLRASASTNPGNVLFTGGSITGTNAAYTLSQSGIPFIHLSSGSVSAIGAITAITALPVAYASAYCWFPANALATVKAAGWYYCTFSTTTAGTAFLDTYVSGAVTIPASPTAVTDGKGAFTSDTAEHGGPSITIPAGVPGAFGSVEVMISTAGTNNANTKQWFSYFNGIAGTLLSGANLASNLAEVSWVITANRGIAASQVTNPIGSGSGLGLSGAGPSTYTAVNTAVSNTYDISLKKATATDNMILERYRIGIMFASSAM